jgi:cytidyltransferase-like protein
MEAVVFDYDGHTYKFAGNFAPLNQILGMFRYSKGGNKLTTENISFDTEVITEEEGKKVALLPGGFKPPHAGHYKLAKELSSLPDIDEVVIIIGKNPRFSNIDSNVVVTAEQSKMLWDIYTKGDTNIKVRIQEGKTPVSDVYDLIADKNSFSNGDIVVLGKSDKDEGDKRYSRAQSWAERHNPGVSVEEMVMPVYGGEGMGGTALRDLIASGDKQKLLSKTPKHLSDDDREQISDILFTTTEDLDRFIDSTIDEMATMASGAVEGSMGSGAFGPPNTYNSFKKRNPNKKATSKRPKVKRAKRQRRR